MSEFITHSREETVALGAQVAQHLAPGALIAFTGGLGAGKTAFCEGIARGLGCTDPVSSPTFAIVNYYRGPSVWPQKLPVPKYRKILQRERINTNDETHRTCRRPRRI